MAKWYNLTQSNDVVEYMKEAKSQADWQRRAHNVRYANNFRLPLFWGTAVIFSGVASSTAANWQRKDPNSSNLN